MWVVKSPLEHSQPGFCGEGMHGKLYAHQWFRLTQKNRMNYLRNAGSSSLLRSSYDCHQSLKSHLTMNWDLVVTCKTHPPTPKTNKQLALPKKGDHSKSKGSLSDYAVNKERKSNFLVGLSSYSYVPWERTNLFHPFPRNKAFTIFKKLTCSNSHVPSQTPFNTWISSLLLFPVSNKSSAQNTRLVSTMQSFMFASTAKAQFHALAFTGSEFDNRPLSKRTWKNIWASSSSQKDGDKSFFFGNAAKIMATWQV